MLHTHHFLFKMPFIS